MDFTGWPAVVVIGPGLAGAVEGEPELPCRCGRVTWSIASARAGEPAISTSVGASPDRPALGCSLPSSMHPPVRRNTADAQPIVPSP
jgi:hypothetical protein